LHNNIPLQALVNLESWRDAYQEVCKVKADRQMLMFRSLLHPTRIGIASPDIPRPTEEHKVAPREVMRVAALLHFLEARDFLESYGQRLKIACNPAVNYDELCGTLQENLALFEQLRSKLPALCLARYPEEGSPTAALDRAWAELRNKHLIASETYGDWEIWVNE
jgi:hypothetical protein